MSGERGTSYSHSFEILNRSETQPFQYTGQRQEVSFGLYDDNARFYEPMLGRFTQSDMLIPNPADPQSWERYAYVRNNPINDTEPTGHETACYEDGDCRNVLLYSKKHVDYVRRLCDIVFSGRWEADDQGSVVLGVQAMAKGLSGSFDLNATIIFRQVYCISSGRTFNFEWDCSACIGFAITLGPRHIKFGGMYANPFSDVSQVVHKLFHMFENAMLPDGADFKDARSVISEKRVNGEGLAPGSDRIWQHRIDGDGRGDIFSDRGVAWTFDVWNWDANNPFPDEAANAKGDWTNLQMGDYIESAISNERQ